MPTPSEAEAFNELCAWSLTRRDGKFVHQFVVDCWALQHATAETKPIGIVFALVSLCLHLEHGQTGRQAQLAHMRLAKQRKEWPRMPAPIRAVDFSVQEILNAETDAARDQAIHRWCVAVWDNWNDAQGSIRMLVQQELGVATKP